MKQPKKLTFYQKVLLTKHGYDPKEYMFQEERRNSFIFKHKENGLFVEIDK